MNKRNKPNAWWSCKAACLAACILAAVATVGCSPKPLVPTPPIPKGEAMIHVEFKGLPNEKFSKLTEFVKQLAHNNSAFVDGSKSERDVGDYNTFLGAGNDGLIDQIYKPNHPIPSPSIEQSMKALLESYLHDNGIDSRDVNLELRYGQ